MSSTNISPREVLCSPRSYCPLKWDQMRNVITRLYRDEGKKLDDVRTILARDYDFSPTTAMMKKRIEKWGLDRKHKLPDMLVALRLAALRKAEGRPTAFVIREQLVTFAEIERYFRRKGYKNLKSVLADAEYAVSTVPIHAHTPEPEDNSTLMEPISYLNFVRQLRAYQESSVLMSADMTTPSIHMSLIATKPLEQLLYLCRSHHDSFFEKLDWKTSKEKLDIRELEIFYRDMFLGQQLLCDKRRPDTEAFTFFNKACGRIHRLLKSEVLLFLPYFYHLVLCFRNTRGQEVVTLLLRFVSEMSQQFPKRDPVLKSMLLLRQVPIAERWRYTGRVLRRILDQTRLGFGADFTNARAMPPEPRSACTEQPQPEHLCEHLNMTARALAGLVKETDILVTSGWCSNESESFLDNLNARRLVNDGPFSEASYHVHPPNDFQNISGRVSGSTASDPEYTDSSSGRAESKMASRNQYSLFTPCCGLIAPRAPGISTPI